MLIVMVRVRSELCWPIESVASTESLKEPQDGIFVNHLYDSLNVVPILWTVFLSSYDSYAPLAIHDASGICKISNGK